MKNKIIKSIGLGIGIVCFCVLTVLAQTEDSAPLPSDEPQNPETTDEAPLEKAPAPVAGNINPFDHLESSPYTVVAGDSLYEIAKKNGTTVELLKTLNSLKGDLIHPGDKLKIVKGTFSIQVDKSDNVLTLLLDDRVLKQYKVATGSEEKTKAGTFKIVNKLENPTWYKAGAVVPPDSPENILGTRWLGFDLAGYGIHGTTEPETIGQHVTSGCVRMVNHDVEELYSLVPTGTQVLITE